MNLHGSLVIGSTPELGTDMSIIVPNTSQVLGDPRNPQVVGQTEMLGTWDEVCLDCQQDLNSSPEEFWYWRFGGPGIGMHLDCFLDWHVRLGADVTTAARLLRHRGVDPE